MNREIKFRVFSHTFQSYEMFYDVEMMIKNDGVWWICDNQKRMFQTSSNRNFLMQFTGLKSSDQGCNMPIEDAYFGDIIEFFNTEGRSIIAEIIWYERELCIGFKRLSDGFVYTQRIFNDSGYFQPSQIKFNIIGNIHENPELLK